MVGQLAQKRGAENAGRLVSSAKSWLSHSGVDRTAALLPFRAPEGVTKVSPVEASRRYLEHLREAWDSRMPDAQFAEQQVLVTVPASFDAVARELTLEAAKQAGYGNITLLEEPQAAFYAWIERHADWRERVQLGDLILVVDIGGGTTDFTLIAVTESERRAGARTHGRGRAHSAGRRQYRSGAGRHGGRAARGERHAHRWPPAAGAVEQLPHRQREAARAGSKAKEQPVTILGKGTGLVGGTIKAIAAARRYRTRARRGISCPRLASNDMPAASAASGLQEFGLPYAADPAITRHLARFLRQQAAAAQQAACAAARAGSPAPPTCCSMAAC